MGWSSDDDEDEQGPPPPACDDCAAGRLHDLAAHQPRAGDPVGALLRWLTESTEN